jgi:hypothetical protein
MLSLNSAAALSFNAPVAPVVRSRVSAPSMLEIEFGQVPWSGSSEISTKAGMEELAKKLNPTVGFYDPLGIVGDDVMPETIGWFRHAEIKHGRVAMAAFVGYCVQANGIHFPWNIQGPFPSGLDTVSFGDISAAGGPADQWDALSTGAKLQILGVVGFLEMWSETSAALELDGQKHYVRGGKPGYFPTLKGRFPHPVPLNLWDPFRLHLEDDARAQGEGAPRRGEQRPPRDDRHLRPHLRLQGPPGPGPRLARHHAVLGRDHGAVHRVGRLAPLRVGHARVGRHPRLLSARDMTGGIEGSGCVRHHSV